MKSGVSRSRWITSSPVIRLALKSRGIVSLTDVVLHLPYRYIDLHLSREHQLADKERVVLYGRVQGQIRLIRYQGRLSLVSFSFLTPAGRKFSIDAWNRPYLKKSLPAGDDYTLVGLYDQKKDRISLQNIYRGRIKDERAIRPVYSLPPRITDQQFRSYMRKGLALLKEEDLPTLVPDDLQKKYRLPTRLQALQSIHFPRTLKEGEEAFRLFKYEECLLFRLKSLLIRKANKALLKNKGQHIDQEKVRTFIDSLMYRLSHDQLTALDQILKDMNDRRLMYRLLMGDVGTGKTLVAALAFYANWLRNDQGAFMAPTAALARQHYLTLKTLLEGTGMRLVLLLGSLKVSQRAAIRKAIDLGRVDLIIGTHALFAKDINYLSLGLVIIDEQHKFGVDQRLQLAKKGPHADLLLLSATPIPRTLALTLYGDLDVSILTEFPLGPRHNVTQIVKRKDHVILGEIRSALKARRNVFIVAPRIASSPSARFAAEDLYRAYLKEFPAKVSLLHGKMPEEDRLAAIDDFLSGVTPILVATTLIEVGIDVPSAGLMIIYEPQCFGLASLHQLRGRVGRDGRPAKCLLVYDDDDEDELARLEVLVRSEDGFYLAEEDLRRRGPGELGGARQAGIASFTYVNLIQDFRMFACAGDDAEAILKKMDDPRYQKLIKKARMEISETNFTDV